MQCLRVAECSHGLPDAKVAKELRSGLHPLCTASRFGPEKEDFRARAQQSPGRLRVQLSLCHVVLQVGSVCLYGGCGTGTLMGKTC